MAKISIWNIKQELVNFLRNQDILSTTERGVTTTTETFSGDDNETDFTLTQTTVKNIRSVSIGGSLQSFGTDYTINLDTAIVSFTTAPTTGTNNISVQLDYGSTDKIFPDFPQPHLKINDFPRIGFDILSGKTTETELGAGTTLTEYPITFVAYDKDHKDVEDIIGTIREKIIDNKKSFYYFPFITLTAMGPITPSPFGQNKILQRNQDAIIRFVYEN